MKKFFIDIKNVFLITIKNFFNYYKDVFLTVTKKVFENYKEEIIFYFFYKYFVYEIFCIYNSHGATICYKTIRV